MASPTSNLNLRPQLIIAGRGTSWRLWGIIFDEMPVFAEVWRERIREISILWKGDPRDPALRA